MPGSISDELLDRYLAGDPSLASADMERVRAWLDSNARHEQIAEALQEVMVSGRPVEVSANTSDEWKKIATAMHPVTQRHKGLPYLRYLGAAAAIGVIALGIKYGSPTRTEKSTLAQSYSTAVGQTANVRLEDGSQITLAPVTTMRVTRRTVELQGEAVFVVKQHVQEPFIVKAGASVTRVLGTRFGVRAYDQNVTVAVSDGKVDVNKTVLVAGDVASIAGGDTKLEHNIDVTSLFSWSSGRLVLDSATLRSAIPDLKRWYGIDISVTDSSLLNSTITTTLSNEPVGEIIEILAGTLRAKASRNGSKVTFSPR